MGALGAEITLESCFLLRRFASGLQLQRIIGNGVYHIHARRNDLTYHRGDLGKGFHWVDK